MAFSRRNMLTAGVAGMAGAVGAAGALSNSSAGVCFALVVGNPSGLGYTPA